MEDHYARKEGFDTRIGVIILASIVILLWFLIGSGQQSERVEEAERMEEQLPVVWLAYKDDLYKGEALGYCWFARCRDDNVSMLNITNIIVRQGDNLGFVVNSIIDHTSMDIRIHRASIDADGKTRVLDRLELKLESIVKDVYKIDLDIGTYAIIAHVTWEGIGYMDYVFSIKVV